MCWAHFDYFCEHGGVIRIYADGQTTDDPFCFSLPFSVVDDQTIELQALWHCPRLCQVHALVKSCKEFGLHVERLRKSGANPGRKHYDPNPSNLEYDA
jgi:hypothetical protein